MSGGQDDEGGIRLGTRRVPTERGVPVGSNWEMREWTDSTKPSVPRTLWIWRLR